MLVFLVLLVFLVVLLVFVMLLVFLSVAGVSSVLLMLGGGIHVIEKLFPLIVSNCYCYT